MGNSKKPSYTGHRKRLKEKDKKSGIGGWLDYEVLELALSYAVLCRDTKPAAKELTARFKTINGVLDAGAEDIKTVKGVSEHTALFLRLLKDIFILYSENRLYDKDLLSSPESVYDYLKFSLKGAVNEEFKALFLNSRNQLVSVETLQTGTVNKAAVYPRKIKGTVLFIPAI